MENKIKKIWSKIYSGKELEDKVYIKIGILRILTRVGKFGLNLVLIKAFWIGIIWLMNNYQKIIEFNKFLSIVLSRNSFPIPVLLLLILVGIIFSVIYGIFDTGEIDLLNRLFGPYMFKAFTFDVVVAVILCIGLVVVPFFAVAALICSLFQSFFHFLELAFRRYIEFKYHFVIRINDCSRNQCRDCLSDEVKVKEKKYSVIHIKRMKVKDIRKEEK